MFPWISFLFPWPAWPRSLLQGDSEAADGAPAAPQPQDFSGRRSGVVKAGSGGGVRLSAVVQRLAGLAQSQVQHASE